MMETSVYVKVKFRGPTKEFKLEINCDIEVETIASGEFSVIKASS